MGCFARTVVRRLASRDGFPDLRSRKVLRQPVIFPINPSPSRTGDRNHEDPPAHCFRLACRGCRRLWSEGRAQDRGRQDRGRAARQGVCAESGGCRQESRGGCRCRRRRDQGGRQGCRCCRQGKCRKRRCGHQGQDQGGRCGDQGGWQGDGRQG
ncbi:MAG TPA: hypothetical protein DHV85_06615, partial [Candidatus Accumulibacter sp.]|nr:hypothetical protein [Accumulibacter sp.]